MTVLKRMNGGEANLLVEGRLDTVTAPDLEKELLLLSEASSLEMDFSKLEYISSAGLRVLLSAHKVFAKKNGMTITNVGEMVMDVFEVTGFKDILSIR
ncbi:MAG: STAS domain-containing protein [Treponema sp.]|nr:STAS domain-containing protein [Treponema sp.]